MTPAEETFIEFKSDTFIFRCRTGDVGIEGRYWIERNDRGEITKKEKLGHYVCLGNERCFECGRKLG